MPIVFEDPLGTISSNWIGEVNQIEFIKCLISIRKLNFEIARQKHSYSLILSHLESKTVSKSMLTGMPWQMHHLGLQHLCIQKMHL